MDLDRAEELEDRVNEQHLGCYKQDEADVRDQPM